MAGACGLAEYPLATADRPFRFGLVPSDAGRQRPKELLAVFCANVIHIAPWRVAEGLFAGAGRYLGADGQLLLYGPFKRDGKHTSVSNAVFDSSLRAGNPEWGVRDIADLEQLAGSAGLALADIAEMPANNLILVFIRKPGD